MRPFVAKGLRRLPGDKIENPLKLALNEDQYRLLESNTPHGGRIEDTLDVNHFAPLVRFYWWDVFRGAFRPEREAWETLFAIAEARNRAAHPGPHDIERDYALARLDDVAGVLGSIGVADECQAVLAIRNELRPFSTPAHKFRQGGRDVYAFTLDLQTLDNLLPDRVDDRMVRDANRPLTKSHAKHIQDYLEDRPDWLLGTLLLGISPDAVKFQSYIGDSDAPTNVGNLTVSAEGAASMKMFDGQHRRRAIKDVLEALRHNAAFGEKLSSLKEASLPVMVYAEDNIDALRQMFADAAHTRPIEANTVTVFDRRDAFNVTAMRVAEESDLFAGRVEMERASVARGRPYLIAINQLARTLKTLELGYSGRLSRARNDAYMLDPEPLFERCWTWADDFMPAAREEYDDLMAGDVDNSEIPQLRETTMAYNATVIRILAGCYHKWVNRGVDWDPLAEFLRAASLEPGLYRDSLLVEAGVVAPGGISPTAARRQVEQAMNYIVDRVNATMGNNQPPVTNG
ncbi:MAG: DGQHR domain-containing protein [Chloroflexi bacterium]|nr:DGQHR domain-containing protein [Chloroflexota bacterium]MCY3937809.1 DGQHR domain-containing protein [Chloroflexota bacterium]